MRTFIALLFLVGAAAGSALACSCWPRKPFCEAPPASAQSDGQAIFLGTVESVAPAQFSPSPLHTRVIRLRVDETFVGSPGQTLEVLAGSGQCCDCSPSFDVGEQYLVVANRHRDLWGTSICSGTSRIDYAARDITALRAWKSGPPFTTSIEGVIQDATPRHNRTANAAARTAGLRVHLTGPESEREALTGSHGQFSFAGLTSARYRLSVSSPGWSAANASQQLMQEVDLTSRTCAHATFALHEEQSTVHGRLNTSAGTPVPSVTMRAISLNPMGDGPGSPSALTNKQGEFTIGELEPGEYIFSSRAGAGPTTYYPGVPSPDLAQRFRIERGQTLELDVWTLPPR